jgi:hypothetical protein
MQGNESTKDTIEWRFTSEDLSRGDELNESGWRPDKGEDPHTTYGPTKLNAKGDFVYHRSHDNSSGILFRIPAEQLETELQDSSNPICIVRQRGSVLHARPLSNSNGITIDGNIMVMGEGNDPKRWSFAGKGRGFANGTTELSPLGDSVIQTVQDSDSVLGATHYAYPVDQVKPAYRQSKVPVHIKRDNNRVVGEPRLLSVPPPSADEPGKYLYLQPGPDGEQYPSDNTGKILFNHPVKIHESSLVTVKSSDKRLGYAAPVVDGAPGAPPLQIHIDSAWRRSDSVGVFTDNTDPEGLERPEKIHVDDFNRPIEPGYLELLSAEPPALVMKDGKVVENPEVAAWDKRFREFHRVPDANSKAQSDHSDRGDRQSLTPPLRGRSPGSAIERPSSEATRTPRQTQSPRPRGDSRDGSRGPGGR